MTQDLQAEINAKEKVQEQLNTIYANAQTLLGDTKKYTNEHLKELEAQIKNAWIEVAKIAKSKTS